MKNGEADGTYIGIQYRQHQLTNHTYCIRALRQFLEEPVVPRVQTVPQYAFHQRNEAFFSLSHLCMTLFDLQLLT